jgi:peptidoglycan/xylan/chitin deacetylase (PgdA/CDA1 family)
MKKQIQGFISKSIGLKFLMKLSGHKHIIPLYHTVSDSPLSHIKHLYKVKTVEEFNKDLEFFLKHYKNVSLNDLIAHLKKSKSKDPVFHLTFDDGLKEIVTIIAPILLEKGIHATFFINPDFLNNQTLFYRFKASILINRIKDGKISPADLKLLNVKLKSILGSSLKEKLLTVTYGNRKLLDEIAGILNVNFNDFLSTDPFVSDSDIQWLLDNGFTIGAHSLDHPLYKYLSIDDQIYQTEKSVEILENKFNLDKRLFAFPFTDSGITKQFFRQINMKKPTYSFGTSGLNYKLDDLNFQRVPMENSSLKPSELLKMYYFKYLLKKITGKGDRL